LPAFRSPLKTCSALSTCRPPQAAKFSRAGFPPTTPPWFASFVRPSLCRSGRPTWTSSPWGRPPSTRPTASPITRGTSTASPADPVEEARQRWLPSKHHSRSAQTPVDRFGSQLPSPDQLGSSPPMAGSVVMARSLSRVRSTRWGPSPARFSTLRCCMT